MAERWPTLAELALLRQTTPGLPSERVIHRVGATATERARRLFYWCQDRDGHDDVAAICARVAARTEQATAPCDNDDDADAGSAADSGWVYLIRSRRFHKIGRSGDPDRRTQDIARQLPEPATLVHQIHTDDPVGIEAYWHRRFAEKRTRGEWFQLNAADIRAFRRWPRVY
ncbi:MAG: GIY-YIG nuclease family protein [Pirellulales bacterium]